MTGEQRGPLHRLFIALTVEGPAADSLAPVRDALAPYGALLKVVPAGNYHITLKFLGEVPEETFRALVEGFARLDCDCGELSYTLKGLGAFPNLRRPQVLWCGFELDRQPVDRLFGTVEEFALSHGFPREKRAFIPHLTLSRVRQGAHVPDELIALLRNGENRAFGGSSFTRLSLYESELRQTGARYTERARLTLSSQRKG